MGLAQFKCPDVRDKKRVIEHCKGMEASPVLVSRLNTAPLIPKGMDQRPGGGPQAGVARGPPAVWVRDALLNNPPGLLASASGHQNKPPGCSLIQLPEVGSGHRAMAA
jgi:hypothetical protein